MFEITRILLPLSYTHICLSDPVVNHLYHFISCICILILLDDEVRQLMKRRSCCAFYVKINIYWWTSQRLHNYCLWYIDTCDSWGIKRFQSAMPHMESCYPYSFQVSITPNCSGILQFRLLTRNIIGLKRAICYEIPATKLHLGMPISTGDKYVNLSIKRHVISVCRTPAIYSNLIYE